MIIHIPSQPRRVLLLLHFIAENIYFWYYDKPTYL